LRAGFTDISTPTVEKISVILSAYLNPTSYPLTPVVECFSLRDRGDREVFPRYELTGLGNSGFAG
jgi:histidyl-tRNA synthetase